MYLTEGVTQGWPSVAIPVPDLPLTLPLNPERHPVVDRRFVARGILLT